MSRSTKSAASSKIDIRGVAARARVSIATVSRTINHVPTVDPALAKRVWKAVKELNYFPNTQARALVSGRSRLFGLIVSEITNPFFPELIQQFEAIAVQHGYEILLGSTSYDAAKTEQCVRRMLERKVDGVAVMTFGIEELLLNRFEEGDIPTVFIDLGPSTPHSRTISVDYQQGITEAIQHLAALGHRDIAFLSGPLRMHSAQARSDAFARAMQQAGLVTRPEWMLEGTHTLDGGRDAMQRMLKTRRWPTAIVCSNDVTAIGVQHALFDARLRVPEDFSLVGFDDIHLAEYTIPPLTTVRMASEDLAHAAIGTLLEMLGTAEAAAGTPVPTHLIVRQTTGSPRTNATAARATGRKSPVKH
ncbi:MAG: LacI family DNA-binding transcriptional regulator [Acidobacteriota bacterium]|nr:LacI family DNA-binding transcriptional regulator [Acidobacteriota bacterium]